MPNVCTAEVALPLPLRELFHYAIPNELNDLAQIGSRVLIPFGHRQLIGCIITRDTTPPDGVTLTNILQVVDEIPVFTPLIISLSKWMADYYETSIGEVLRCATPPGSEPEPVAALKRVVTPSYINQKMPEWLASLPVSELVIAKDLKVSPRQIQAAIKAGWLERTFVILEPKIAPRSITQLKAVQAVPARKRPLRCDEIQAWLLEHGPTSIPELRRVFTNATPHLRRLIDEGLCVEEEVEQTRDPFFGTHVERDTPPKLSDEQQHALDECKKAEGFHAFLLQGVTGSGKTEVYLHLIEHTISQGKRALVLVPEIALTPQLVQRFRARFGNEIAVLHSGLSPQSRFEQWRKCRKGEVSIAIGARSGVFAPLDSVGLIIVDEEHDPSFKQGDRLRYQGRDMALVRAKLENATIVLGSATPSLESTRNAQLGKYTLLRMTQRPTGGQLPQVELVDLRIHRPPNDGAPLFSLPLRDAISETLERHEQGILFLNRRGFSHIVICGACGQRLECNICSIGYTWHQAEQRLRCHYCDARLTMPPRCPHCGADALILPGQGTERVEEALHNLWPQARVLRLDRDAVSSAKRLEAVLSAMRRGEADILIGTQMVTKGHDFPGVTFVGVLSADESLGFPDFRAAERTFQLLTQVAGRAGRAQRPGRVLIQTFDPDHFCLQAIAAQDHAAFSEQELHLREIRHYPPFGYAVLIRFEGEDRKSVELLAKQVANEILKAKTQVTMRGPTFAPIALIKGVSRMMLLLLAPKRAILRQALAAIDHSHFQQRVIKVILDVDPYDFL